MCVHNTGSLLGQGPGGARGVGGSPIRGVGTEGAHAQCLILRQTVPPVSHLIDWRTMGVITCHVRGHVLNLTAARGTRPNRPSSTGSQTYAFARPLS